MNPNNPTALIAEDEPLLAHALAGELQRAWPALRIVATVGDGVSAVRDTLALQPDVLFFDIRMPGMSGLEAASELAEQWRVDGPQARKFPALVFVTAYDQYAVQAFEAQAVDYLLKPVQAARLQKTIDKLQQTLAQPAQYAMTLEATMAQLRGLLAGPTQVDRIAGSAAEPLKVLAVGIGNAVHMVPVDDVVYFEAADKYVRVLTTQREYLIRTPLKDLLPRLHPDEFCQIHRGTVVRSSHIARVIREESGKMQLSLRTRPEKLQISRLYAHLFKAM